MPWCRGNLSLAVVMNPPDPHGGGAQGAEKPDPSAPWIPGATKQKKFFVVNDSASNSTDRMVDPVELAISLKRNSDRRLLMEDVQGKRRRIPSRTPHTLLTCESRFPSVHSPCCLHAGGFELRAEARLASVPGSHKMWSPSEQARRAVLFRARLALDSGMRRVVKQMPRATQARLKPEALKALNTALAPAMDLIGDALGGFSVTFEQGSAVLLAASQAINTLHSA